MGWLNQCPKIRCRREVGHATPKMGLSNRYPNVSLSRVGGHRSDFIDAAPTPLFSTRSLRPFGQTTDLRPITDIHPCSSTNSDHSHSSTAALSTRSSIGSAHIKRRARTTGTRLERQALELLVLGRVFDWQGDHKVEGVRSSTRTCKVGTLRQALHTSRDASCSSSVDAYHRFSPPSHAWLKATMKASRHRFVPEIYRLRGRNEDRGSTKRRVDNNPIKYSYSHDMPPWQAAAAAGEKRFSMSWELWCPKRFLVMEQKISGGLKGKAIAKEACFNNMFSSNRDIDRQT